jgi:hypothetical protein
MNSVFDLCPLPIAVLVVAEATQTGNIIRGRISGFGKRAVHSHLVVSSVNVPRVQGINMKPGEMLALSAISDRGCELDLSLDACG